MAPEHFSADEVDADALLEIESRLEQVAQLSRTAIAARTFYSELLAVCLPGVGAIAGAVWRKEPTGFWQLEYQINLTATGLTNPAARMQHEQLLGHVAHAGTIRLWPPHSGSPEVRLASADGSLEALPAEFTPSNDSEYPLALAPVVVEGEALAVIELVLRPTTSTGALRGAGQFLQACAELATDFHQQTNLRELRTEQQAWQQQGHFARLVHGSLDVTATAYATANEGRRLIGCDRVCVLLRRRRWNLVAVSGSEAFDPRANFVRTVEALASAALGAGDELWFTEDWHSLPPEVERPLHEYLDQCHTRSIGVVPLKSPGTADQPGEVFGALVIEQFQSGLDESAQRRASVVREHGGLALHNARALESLPLANLLRRAGKLRWLTTARQLPKTLLALGALLLAVVLLIAIPAELRITARGELQPAVRRDVFAPMDGVIEKLSVQHGKQVTAGEVLALLRSPELELAYRRLEGETQTAQKKLEAITAARVEQRGTTNTEQREYQRLAAEEQEVKAELAGLAAQKEILDRQQQELTLRSPVAGQVLTWDVSALLDTRPVARGQVLLTVAEVTGPWELELRLPDERSGHVLAAYQNAQAAGEQVPVEYLLATTLGTHWQGHIERVALAADVDRENVAGVSITVRLDASQPAELRPGATVSAKIDCGRRSLGYVWLHDLIDAVRGWMFF